MFISFREPYPPWGSEFNLHYSMCMDPIFPIPEIPWYCTMEKGHDSNHRASGNGDDWFAEWDDDRTTDQQPFFITFGQQYPREPHPTFPKAHHDGWVTLYADSAEDARRTALDIFERRYAFDYDAKSFEPHYYPLGELAVYSTRQIRQAERLPIDVGDHLVARAPDLRIWIDEAE